MDKRVIMTTHIHQHYYHLILKGTAIQKANRLYAQYVNGI